MKLPDVKITCIACILFLLLPFLLPAQNFQSAVNNNAHPDYNAGSCAGSVSPSPIPVICIGDSIQITYTFSGLDTTSGPVTFYWINLGSPNDTLKTFSATFSSGTDSLFIIPDSTGLNTFLVTDSLSGCESYFIINTLGPPGTPGAITGSANVCEGTQQAYSVGAVPGATAYTWSLPAGWSGSSTTNTIAVTAGVTGGSISVTAMNNCGISAASNLSITVNSNPVVTASASPNPVCAGLSVMVSANSSNCVSCTYSWNTGQTTASIDTNVSVQTTFIATATNPSTNCFDRDTVVVSVIPVPQITGAVYSASMCSGLTQEIQLQSNVGNVTYNWTRNSALTGMNFSGTETDSSITVTLINVGSGTVPVQFTVTPSAVGCTGSSQNYSINVNPVPALSPVADPSPICSGGTINVTATIANSVSGIINWTRNNSNVSGMPNSGTGSPITGTLTIPSNDGTPDTVGFIVTPVSIQGGCAGVADTFFAIVNPVPQTSLSVTPSLICSGQLVNLSLTSSNNVGGSSFSWSRNSPSGFSASSTFPSTGTSSNASGSLINENLSGNITVLFTALITGPAPTFCAGPLANANVTVRPGPPLPTYITRDEIIASIAASDTVCHKTRNLNFGIDEAFLQAHSSLPLSFTWSSSPSGIIAFVSDDSTHCLVNVKNQSGNVTHIITLTIDNGSGCTVNLSDTFVVRSSGTSPDSVRVILHPISNTLVCLDNTASIYQWGYDEVVSLLPKALTGETFQDYIAGSSFDTLSRYYWVITYYGGCYTKVYYNKPYGRYQQDPDQDNIPLVVYPVPSAGIVTLSSTQLADEIISIKIFSCLGQLVQSSEIRFNNAGLAVFSIEDLAEGMYLMQYMYNAETKKGIRIIKTAIK